MACFGLAPHTGFGSMRSFSYYLCASAAFRCRNTNNYTITSNNSSAPLHGALRSISTSLRAAPCRGASLRRAVATAPLRAAPRHQHHLPQQHHIVRHWRHHHHLPQRHFAQRCGISAIFSSSTTSCGTGGIIITFHSATSCGAGRRHHPLQHHCMQHCGASSTVWRTTSCGTTSQGLVASMPPRVAPVASTPLRVEPLNVSTIFRQWCVQRFHHTLTLMHSTFAQVEAHHDPGQHIPCNVACTS